VLVARICIDRYCGRFSTDAQGWTSSRCMREEVVPSRRKGKNGECHKSFTKSSMRTSRGGPKGLENAGMPMMDYVSEAWIGA